MWGPWVRPPARSFRLERRRWLLATASLSVGGATRAQQAGTPRVALLIGNAAYASSPLRNAVNDAGSIAEVLREQGFTVHLAQDVGRLEMEAAIARAADELRDRRGVGLLYYAGHGLQLGWRNFMVPVGARIETAADVPRQTVDVQRVLDSFNGAGTRMNIVVLDACRHNPFGRLASGRGLASMDAPPGTLLAYATAPGNVAEDGTAAARNGPYAQHLAQELQRPDARVEDVFKRVRFAVRRQTAGRQVPWESTSLEEDFSFSRGTIDPLPSGPGQRHATFDEEFAEWKRIAASTDAEDFYRFLARFPSGPFSELAQLRIERLQRASVSIQAGASGVSPPDTTIRRYEVGDVFWWEVEDQLKGQKRNLRFSVTAADDERVEFNFGAVVVTQTGGVVKNQFGSNDPPVVELVADMAVGKRWRSAFVQTQGDKQYRTFYESKVVAQEDIDLPVGPVKAFRVEHHGESLYPDGRTSILQRTTWIDVKRGLVVRGDAAFGWPPLAPGRPARLWHKTSTRLVGEERRRPAR